MDIKDITPVEASIRLQVKQCFTKKNKKNKNKNNLTIIPFSLLWNRNTATETSCIPEINYVSDNSATRGGTDNHSESDFPFASPP